MSVRLRLFVIFLGALVVAATYTFPIWWPRFQREAVEQDAFPGLASELQNAYLSLPANTRRLYTQMRDENPFMALDVLTAALSPDVPVPEAAQQPPNVSTATIAARANFAPIDMRQVDNASEASPYMSLFSAAGRITIYEFPDSRKLLWVEDFRVTNGPSLRIVLAQSPAPLTVANLGRDFIDLGLLQGTSGSQAYEIPREINLSNYRSVVIFSPTYGLIYGVAGF